MGARAQRVDHFLFERVLGRCALVDLFNDIHFDNARFPGRADTEDVGEVAMVHFAAGQARVTGVVGDFPAIQGLGEFMGGHQLPNPARPPEQESVGHAALEHDTSQ